jgi:hypothetical protein
MTCENSSLPLPTKTIKPKSLIGSVRPASAPKPEKTEMAIDRNARARLVFQAEAYERRTKAKGSRGGSLMPSGIQVLRAIAFVFLNLPRGAAWPSYDALQRATGLCRQTIADAIRRLEAAGFLLVTRRCQWEGRKLVKLTNWYELPVKAPPLPDHESLLNGRQPQSQKLIPWDEWKSPVKNALEAWADAIIERSEVNLVAEGGTGAHSV